MQATGKKMSYSHNVTMSSIWLSTGQNLIYPPPLITKFGGCIGNTLSVCLSVCVSHLCPEDIWWTTKLYATKLGMMVHHHDLEHHAKRLSCCLEGQGHSASSHLCPEDIVWTTKLYATKLGMMVRHHDPECHAKRLDCYLEGQGHSASSNPKKILFLVYMLDFWTLCNQIYYSGQPGQIPLAS